MSSSRRLAYGVAVLLLTCAVGVVGYLASGWNLLDAVYMVVITVFGVGYGEINDLGPEMRAFTIVIIVAGCSSLIYIMGGFFQMLTEGELNRALGQARMHKELDSIEQHAIQERGLQTVVVDSSAEQLAAAREHGCLTVQGDATSDEVLKRAGIERARALATVLHSDALNVFITLTARHINPNLLIIARAEEPSTAPKLQHAGADRVVLPTSICAERMAQVITKPAVLEFFEQADLSAVGQELSAIGIEIEQFAVTPAMVGRTVGQIESYGPGGFIVVAVRRAGGSLVHNPPPSFELVEEDRVLLMGHRDNLPDLERHFAVKRKKRMYRGAVVDV